MKCSMFSWARCGRKYASELMSEGLRPVSPDMEALETISRAAVERAKGVAMLQSELLEAEEQQNLQRRKNSSTPR